MSSNTNPSEFEIVTEFYEVMDEPIPTPGPATLDPEVIPEKRLRLKMNLIAEEFAELVEAVYGKEAEQIILKAYKKAVKADDGTRDAVKTLDALADLVVVQNGLAIEARMPVYKALQEVHLSNLSKLDPETGEAIRSDGVTPALHDGEVKPEGKILKGSAYFEPDLEAIVEGREPDRTPLLEKMKTES